MSYMDSHAGIIFLYEENLWIDSTPVPDAVDYRCAEDP